MTRPFRPYDGEEFRDLGHRLVDRLARYLDACGDVKPGREASPPVLDLRSPTELEREWSARFEDCPDGDRAERAMAFVEAVLAASNHLHQPGYIGHQVSAPLPFAALCEMLSALLNNGLAVFEMGQLQTIFERRCIEWMARKVGYGPGAGGLFTSGGSLGNLTALLAARQARTGTWKAGSREGPPLAVLASQDSHYCISRALQIMGLGEDSLLQVPLDGRHRLRTELLPEILAAATARGQRVFALVASSCSTATGAFDQLEPMADFCEAHQLWLHVDGAHGASHLVSRKHRAALAGIERSDSVVWDAHKLMLMPAHSTAVLYRDDRHATCTFAQEAAYLFEDSMAGYDLGHRTLECTKRAMGLTLYASLHIFGSEIFEDFVDRTVDLAQAFASLILASEDFSLALPPQTNIVCFRYTPPGSDPGDLDALQDRLRRGVLQDGAFYLVQVRLPEGLHLRVALMNPRTSLADLEELLSLLRELGQKSPCPSPGPTP